MWISILTSHLNPFPYLTYLYIIETLPSFLGTINLFLAGLSRQPQVKKLPRLPSSGVHCLYVYPSETLDSFMLCKMCLFLSVHIS